MTATQDKKESLDHGKINSDLKLVISYTINYKNLQKIIIKL